MLKSKGRNWLLAIVSTFIASTSFAQNLQISGGNSHTVAICESGDIFAWGKNDVGQLGPSGPAGFSNTPILVTGFPLGLDIKQTDAGSGSHTLALGCDGSVYAWGANGTGQLGNGSAGGSSATPVKVVGIGGTGFLNGVKYVSGGNDESFAIMNDGRLVSWGQNDKGQLGNNTTTSRNFPNYVLKCDGTPLTNVIQVEAGDENCYALLSDGSVWSWGDNADNGGAALGRPPAVNPHCAQQVVYGNNTDDGFTTTPVTNIVSISAGDRHVLMLDGTGEVWSFGGDWGVGQLGQGKGYQKSAHKVLAPKTFSSPWTTDPYTVNQEYNTGPYLTGVTAISAGQAHSMAVLSDGSIVTFGANGFYDCGTSCAYLAGQLGIGMTVGTNNKGVEGPGYGLTAAGVQLQNVVGVSDGDAISIAILANGDVYIAGSNSYGQAGIGSGGSAAGDQSSVNYFRKITIPSCTFSAPCPVKPNFGVDFSKCPLVSHTLYANVAPRPTYNYSWEYSATGTAPWMVVKNVTTFPTANADNLTFTTNGYYRLIITDDRASLPANCAPCSAAGDTIHITDPVANFGDPGNLTFCGTTATVNVTETGASATAAGSTYEWYAANTGGAVLATTTDIATATLNITTLVKTGTAPNRTAEVWVEDKSTFNAALAPKAPMGLGNQQTFGPRRINFAVLKSLSLNSVTVEWKSYSTSALTLTLRDAANTILATGSFTPAGAGDLTNTITFSPTPSLPPGNYYIESNQDTRQYNTPGNAYTTIYASSGVNLLDFTSYGTGTAVDVFPPFYNWNVTVGSPYPCGRLKVLIDENCPPCNKPTSVTVNGGTSPINKCVGDPAFTTTGSYVNAGNPIANTAMTYVWYKQGSTPGTPTALTAPTPATTTASQTVPVRNFTSPVVGDAGTWILRVEDGNTGNALCYTESSVVLNVNPLPTISGTLTVCQGLTTTLTGTATAHATTPWASATPAVATVSNTGVVTGVSAGTSVITYMNTNGCTQTATVTVNAKPTIGGTLTICQGLTTTLTGSGTPHATTPWASATPAVATVSSTGVVTGIIGGTSVITYMTSSGCTEVATVTVNAKPTISGTLTVCQGLTTTLTGTATAHATTPWASATPAVATVSNTGVVTGVSAGTSVITYMNTNGCTQTATVTVNAKPTIGGTLIVCQGLTTTLTGSGTPHATTPWASATPSVATVSNTGVVTGIIGGTSVITYMTSSGCTEVATVTVNAKPTIGGTLTVCQGLTTTLTGTATAHATTPWASATPAVATVSNTGVVTGVTAGTSVITYMNTNGCTQTATVTVSATPTIGGTLTVCAGLTTTLTGSGTPNATTPWASATPSVATVSNTGVVTGVSAGTSVITYMTSAGCINTATVTVNASPVPSVTIATPSTTICTGTSVTFTPTPVNGGTPTYQWFRGTAPTGTLVGSGATYTTTTAANNDSYYAVMTSTATCANPATATSNAIVMAVTTVVTPAVTIAVAPGTTICAGTSITFTATPGNGGPTPTYEWFKGVVGSGTSLGAASTSNTYTTTTAANGDSYYVTMTSNSTCVVAPGTANSTAIVMTVNANLTPAVAIAVSPTGSICPGASLTFTATPTNGGTPVYTWKRKPLLGPAVTVGTNSATYTTTTAVDGDIYTVEMVSNATCAPTTPVTSNPITITVTPVPTIAVSISPDVTSICANNPVVFTATASGTGSTPAPTYEWFVTSDATPGTANAVSQGLPSTTATTFATSALTTTKNKVYVQVVSNATCASTAAVASNVVSITVNAGIGAGTIGSDQVICYNSIPSALTETVAPTSIVGVPTYVWKFSLTSSGPFNPIPLATNIGYTPTLAITQDVYLQREITDPGTPTPCNVATSNTIHITVRPQLVAGIIGTSASTCSGAATSTMSETTAPTGGTGTYTYQWQSAPDAGGVPGVFTDIPAPAGTGATYNAGNLTATTYYQRVETSGTCGSVTSNIVTKTIASPEVVTVSINDPGQICASSGAFNFVATASTTGTGTLSYAWTLTDPATAISTPVGTDSPNYSYTPVVGDDNKTVKVVVTTSTGCNAGPGTSNVVTLDIVNAITPTVTLSGEDTNCAGLMNIFSVSSTGGGTAPGPTYQWYVVASGSPVGATGTAVGTGGITYSNSTLANGDRVRVEMTSSSNCLASGLTNPFKSTEITMIIKPIPAPSIIEGDQTICSPNTFTFHGNVTSGNTYEWRNGTTVVGTNADFTAIQGGTYTLHEDNGTCNSTSQPVVLTIVQTPIANAGTDMYLKEGDAGSLNGSGGSVYSWSPATYLSSATVSNPNFTATQTITYQLTVSNTSGTTTCSTTDDVTVFVVKPIIVPNVITVNGDGSNDDWYLENIEGYPNAIIEIYNRWGNLVWKSEGYPKNWDGTNFRNGQVLPDGTYFYIINLQSQVYPEPLTGWVQIMK